MKNLSLQNKSDLAKEFNLSLASIDSFLEVESGGKGYDETTGKILIQFEPSWFKRKSPYTPSGKWSVNGVEKQSAEWIAFNDAFKKDPEAAMQSTSWGIGQVMGFHFYLLGFKTVGSFVDYAKESEYNQLRLSLLFIRSNKKMHIALMTNDFATFAYYYNGSAYKKYKYDTRLEASYKKALKKYN